MNDKKNHIQYRYDDLKSRVKLWLPKLNENQVDEFISDLENALEKYPDNKVSRFINSMAIGIALNKARKGWRKHSADKKKKAKQILKQIEKFRNILKELAYFNDDDGKYHNPKFEFYCSTEVCKAIELLKIIRTQIQRCIKESTSYSKGRPLAKADFYSYQIGLQFNDIFEQPTQTKNGPFYNIIKAVRKAESYNSQFAGLDYNYPDKTVNAVVKRIEEYNKELEEFEEFEEEKRYFEKLENEESGNNDED